MKEVCLKCGGTGTTVDGSPCDCKTYGAVKMPIVYNIPSVYQDVEFSASLVPMTMPREYGIKLEDIINHVKSKGELPFNALICSPPNSGKTVFGYTIFRAQYIKGLPMPDIIDLIEARDLLFANTWEDDVSLSKDKLFNSPIAVIKIPLDLPPRFAETMSTIIERRVRKNGKTIFLYGNSWENLARQDRYSVLTYLIRDGSNNSLKLLEYMSNGGK